MYFSFLPQHSVTKKHTHWLTLYLSVASLFTSGDGLISKPFTIFSMDLSSEGCCWPGKHRSGKWCVGWGETIFIFSGVPGWSSIGRGESLGLEWPDGVTVSNADKLPPPRTLVELELSEDVEDEEAVAGGIKGYGRNRCAFSLSESNAATTGTNTHVGSPITGRLFLT